MEGLVSGVRPEVRGQLLLGEEGLGAGVALVVAKLKGLDTT